MERAFHRLRLSLNFVSGDPKFFLRLEPLRFYKSVLPCKLETALFMNRDAYRLISLYEVFTVHGWECQLFTPECKGVQGLHIR